MKKLGPMEDLLKLLPGVGSKLKDFQFDDRAIARTEAIIQSMTPLERVKPQTIDGSRRKRIARGSGTSVQDVNRFLKEFENVQKMVKMMGKMGKGKKGMPMLP